MLLARVTRNASRLRMHRNPTPVPPVKPLGLTDSEYDAVLSACRPLDPHRRSEFLEDLANEASI
jgi:hypothetical protein